MRKIEPMSGSAIEGLKTVNYLQVVGRAGKPNRECLAETANSRNLHTHISLNLEEHKKRQHHENLKVGLPRKIW